MLNLRYLSLNCLFNDANTIMLIFCYFTGCISHLSLIIILNKTSVFIHLEAATGRSSTKLLFYISGKPIKISQWKCSIFISNFTKTKLLDWYFSKTLVIQSVWCSAEQLFWRIFIFRSSSLRKCYVKKVFLKFSQNSQESASVRISF